MDIQQCLELWNSRNPDNRCQGLADGYVIAYFYHEVLVGTWVDGKASFTPDAQWDKLMELHVFNPLEELRAIYSQDYGQWEGNESSAHWLVRYRKDAANPSEGDKANWFDEPMMIIGNRAGNASEGNGNFKTVSEAGRQVNLPKGAWGKRLLVRNYLVDKAIDAREGMPPLTSLRIGDYRFVDFVSEEEVHTYAKPSKQ